MQWARGAARVARHISQNMNGSVRRTARVQPRSDRLFQLPIRAAAQKASPHVVQTDTNIQDNTNHIPEYAPADDVELVVRNLLYNHPDPVDLPEDPDGQVLSVLVEDEPGVLSRVASLLSGRGHNIKSLSVSPTSVAGISRMTITVLASVVETRKIVRQIESVEETWAVLQSSRVDSVYREVVLVKMSTAFDDVSDPKERIRLVHQKRSELMELTELFKGEIIDVGMNHVTIQLTAWPKRIDALIELARPYGIVEVARSGVVAMGRSKVAAQGAFDTDEDEMLSLSDLPPS